MSCIVKILSVLIVLQKMCLVHAGRVKRVIGGIEVACGTQPRVASLRNATTSQHICGATFLSPHFALTAAHCVSHPKEDYELLLNNYCAGEMTVKVLEILVHELHDEYSRAHDIALIRVHLDGDTTWLNRTALPTSSLGLSGECTMYGYGFRNRNAMEVSEKLLAGEMSIVSLDQCIARLGQYVAPKPEYGMLCAMGNGVDACQGDSGGPLICDGLVQAISSYGMSCGVPGLPGVFTSVGAHLQWIQDIILTL